MKRQIRKNNGSTQTDTIVAIIVITMIVSTTLMAIVPSMSRARESSLRAICANRMRQIGAAMAAYASEYDDKMPWTGGVTGSVPDDTKDESTLHPWLAYRCGHTGNDSSYQDLTKPCSCGMTGKARPMRMACLYESGHVNDARIFYCPANEFASYRYESYTEQDPAMGGPSNEWGRPHQVYNIGSNDWIRTGYDYYPIDKNITGLPPYEGMRLIGRYYVPAVTCRKFSMLSDVYPYLTDMIWSKTGISHKSGSKVEEGKTILINAGVNALYNDGHIAYHKDKPVTVSYYPNQKLFDNRWWELLGTPPQVFYYNMFKLLER